MESRTAPEAGCGDGSSRGCGCECGCGCRMCDLYHIKVI